MKRLNVYYSDNDAIKFSINNKSNDGDSNTSSENRNFYFNYFVGTNTKIAV